MGFTELKAHQWCCVFTVLRQYDKLACCESMERCNHDIITSCLFVLILTVRSFIVDVSPLLL